MGNPADNELRRFFAVLSHEDRLRIAGALAAQPASLPALTTTLGLGERDVSRHLAMLLELGVVKQTGAVGAEEYALDVAWLREQRKRLLARPPAPAAEPGTAETDRAVLRSFFDGERLKEIPASLKKRLVVLGWLVEWFEPGVRYPEPQVNAIIKRHHPDASALRRELVDHGFMRREHGVYWRIDRNAARANPSPPQSSSRPRC